MKCAFLSILSYIQAYMFDSNIIGMWEPLDNPFQPETNLKFLRLREIISWRDKIKDFKMVTESFLRTFFWQCAYLKPSSQSWLFIKIEIWYPKTLLRNEIARKSTYMSEGDINNVTSKKWPKICYFGGKFDFPYAFWSEEVLVSTQN